MKIKAYMSHSIRGKAGDNATNEQMAANNEKALAVGIILENTCPKLQLYVPGRMDSFLINQGIRPLDVVEALLKLDCAIIEHSDLLLVYTPDCYLSGGMKIEINRALNEGIQVFYFSDTNECTIKILNSIIGSLQRNK